jgi:hypothetical protein
MREKEIQQLLNLIKVLIQSKIKPSNEEISLKVVIQGLKALRNGFVLGAIIETCQRRSKGEIENKKNYKDPG